MGSAKVAITLEESVLHKLDALVAKHLFPNRSRAVQAAVAEKIARIERSRLARECAKLNPREEQALSEEGYAFARLTPPAWP